MTSFTSRIRRSTLFLLAVLLAIFCLSLYGSLSLLLYRHIDEQLLALAQAQAKHVEDDAEDFVTFAYPSNASHGGRRSEEDKEDELEDELREAIRESVVLDVDGRVLWKGKDVEFRDELAQQEQARVLSGEVLFDTLRLPRGQTVRRISFPIMPHQKVIYILQTQMSLEGVKETLQFLLLMLGMVAFLTLMLGWLGSNWMAGTVLAPVEALSRTAARVSAQLLGTRVWLDAPYQEFQELAGSFNTMLDRLQRVFESQRRFVADAAHELKTPLTAMKGNLEVALQRARSLEEYRDVLTANLGQVEHLTRLTKSMLTLTQFAGDRPPVEVQPLLLTPLIEEVANELAVLAEGRGCHLITHLDTVPFVGGDSAQLKQLVVNVLDNAIRHTPKGGTITVTLKAAPQEVVFSVHDTGFGIPAEHLPHVFERFYRVDSARDREVGGTGLGLAIAQEIALAHKGTLTVESEIGKGSTFTFRIPIDAHLVPKT